MRDRTTPSEPPRISRLTWETGQEMSPAISPDGSSFVFVRGPAGNRDIFLRRVGGETSINLTRDSTVDDLQPSYSPDGQRIAFRSERDSGGIFIMGSTGESVRRVTNFGFDPHWSPDGKSLAIAIESSTAYSHMGIGGIVVVDVASGGRRKVCDCDALRPTFSPGGKRIAFLTKSSASSYAIGTIPVSGGKAVTLPVNASRSMPFIWLDTGFTWTRTGVWFNAANDLWKIDIDESTGEERDAARRSTTLTAAAGPASATPDGRRIIFPVSTSMFDLRRYAFDARAGKPQPEETPLLTTARGMAISTYDSPDGKWLGAYIESGGQWWPGIIRSDGTESRALFTPELRFNSYSWMPDSSRIIVSAVDGRRTSLLLVRIDGSGYEQFASPPLPDGQVFEPIMSRDGRWMTVLVGKEEIPYLIKIAGPSRTASPLPAIDTGRVFFPLVNGWSRDGRSLLGWSQDKSMKYVEPVLYRFDPETMRYEQLATLDGHHHEWILTWFPDSRRILLFRIGHRDLKILDSATREIHDGGQLPRPFTKAILSVDGRSLFTTMNTMETDVWMMTFANEPARSAN